MLRPQCLGRAVAAAVAADPVGYLKIGFAGATFKPISDVRLGPAFLLAAGVTAAIGMIWLRALRMVASNRATRLHPSTAAYSRR